MNLLARGGISNSELDRRTVRKLDLILLPFLSLLFLLNSLDRSNIGNAETANFTRDAGLQPEDLNYAVACFFVFFVALQPVGAAAGRKFGMSKWVPSVMTIWGICTLLHIWVRHRWQLITIRIIIGMLEGERFLCPAWVNYAILAIRHAPGVEAGRSAWLIMKIMSDIK
jgi:MFS family permease